MYLLDSKIYQYLFSYENIQEVDYNLGICILVIRTVLEKINHKTKLLKGHLNLRVRAIRSKSPVLWWWL